MDRKQGPGQSLRQHPEADCCLTSIGWVSKALEMARWKNVEKPPSTNDYMERGSLCTTLIGMCSFLTRWKQWVPLKLRFMVRANVPQYSSSTSSAAMLSWWFVIEIPLPKSILGLQYFHVYTAELHRICNTGACESLTCATCHGQSQGQQLATHFPSSLRHVICCQLHESDANLRRVSGDNRTQFGNTVYVYIYICVCVCVCCDVTTLTWNNPLVLWHFLREALKILCIALPHRPKRKSPKLPGFWSFLVCIR